MSPQINVTDQIVKHSVPGKWVEFDLFVNKDQLTKENISAGDEIFLLGYPDAIYDPRNVHPLPRKGTILTVPSDGYWFNDRLKSLYGFPDKLDGFLLDANVYPGSSGSLVILKQQSSTIGSKGEILFGAIKKRPYLLGIVSASIPIDDTALASRQRMGIGVAHSASVVRETVDQLSTNGTTVSTTRGVVRQLLLDDNEPGAIDLFESVSGHTITITVVHDVPKGACVTGNLLLRSKGGPGSTLYICENSSWVAK